MIQPDFFPDPADRDFLLNPFPFYARMRRDAPVAGDSRGGLWVVFSYGDVQRVLSDHEAFSSKVPFPRGQKDFTRSLNFTDPPEHRPLRALVQQAFTRKRVEEMAPRIAELVHELIDAVASRGEADLVAALAVPLPVVVIAEILGVPAADRADFKRWSDAVILNDQRAIRDLADYFRRLIGERRGEDRGDLISDLVAAHEADGAVLGEQELVDFCALLLVAGNETTTNLLVSLVRSLDEQPEARERLHADRSLVGSAVEETLRYRSPVQALRRASVAEVALGGVRIPAGQQVLAHVGSANRDEARFESPDEFWVDREPNRHLAFGQGVHFCLGAPLARLEARIVLTALLERLPKLRVRPGAELEPIPTWVAHGVTALPVVF